MSLCTTFSNASFRKLLVKHFRKHLVILTIVYPFISVNALDVPIYDQIDFVKYVKYYAVRYYTGTKYLIKFVIVKMAT